MLESILNRIAERSQALKEKDAEIEILESVVAHKDTQVAQLIEDGKFRDNRIVEKDAEIALWTEDSAAMEVRNAELQGNFELAYDAARAATARADAAESQLLQIAEALRIEVETPIAEQAEEPALEA